MGNDQKFSHTKTFSQDFSDEKKHLIILAGNPNVGKSTLFNALTGLNQHTGNWSGKTVSSAFGTYAQDGEKYILADVPGCYSLRANSEDEVCAANAIYSDETDAVIVVCDAGALERNLNLVLQICEAVPNVLMCVNLADEALKDGIKIDMKLLEKELKIPVVKINARKKKGFSELFSSLPEEKHKRHICVSYGNDIEKAIRIVEKPLGKLSLFASDRYISVRLLENDERIWKRVKRICEEENYPFSNITDAYKNALDYLSAVGICEDDISDIIAINIVRTASRISKKAVSVTKKEKTLSKTFDSILTGKISGFAIMLALLSLVFYITLKGANYPSAYLSKVLFSLETPLYRVLEFLKLPTLFCDMIVFGGYRVLAWVVSVMLPPMAIFFPLFTLLEDVGYLPRVAFNLDKAFKKCKTCGKQALTTCMGFGCNASAVIGTRIIDSKRERLVAMLTNAFIPCNGRFPSLICLICIFFTSSGVSDLTSSLILSLFVVIGILMSLFSSWVLSSTILKGVPSSFTLELPPFRKPQIGQIIIRSLLNRTIFVLFRAAVVAFPTGIAIWILSNITISGVALCQYLIKFFNPLGKVMGLDGTILLAFLLGLPANEIVLPIALMLYSSGTTLVANDSFSYISSVLSSNGWTFVTGLCAIIFFIMHWPCSTTLISVKKESGSFKWAFVSFLLPTLFGVCFCIVINLISKLLV